MPVGGERRSPQYHRTCIALVSFLYALAFTVLYPTLPFFARRLATDSGAKDDSGVVSRLSTGLMLGAVTSAYGVAKIGGTSLVGFVSDRVGRRAALHWTLIGSALAAFASASCSSLAQLVAARFAAGCFGGNAALLVLYMRDVTGGGGGGGNASGVGNNGNSGKCCRDDGGDAAEYALLYAILDCAWKAAHFVAPPVVSLLGQDYCTCAKFAATLFFLAAALARFLFDADDDTVADASAGTATTAVVACRGVDGAPDTVSQVAAIAVEAPAVTSNTAVATATAVATVGARPFVCENVRETLCAHPIVWAVLLVGALGPAADLAPIMTDRFGSTPSGVAWANGLKHGVGLAASLSGVVPSATRRFGVRHLTLIGLAAKFVLFAALAYGAPTLVAFCANLALQAVVAAVCNGAEEAFVQGFARGGPQRLGAYVGVTHGLRGFADASGFLIAAVLSQLDVRWPWLLGACGRLLALALVLALDRSPSAAPPSVKCCRCRSGRRPSSAP